MNKAELNQSLEFLNNPTGELQIIMYACFEGRDVKKLDIKAEDLTPIRKMFVDSVNRAVIEKEEFSVMSMIWICLKNYKSWKGLSEMMI